MMRFRRSGLHSMPNAAIAPSKIWRDVVPPMSCTDTPYVHVAPLHRRVQYASCLPSCETAEYTTFPVNAITAAAASTLAPTASAIVRVDERGARAAAALGCPPVIGVCTSSAREKS